MSCCFELETRPETLMRVIAALEGNDTVTQIDRVTGRNKLHVHAMASSAEEMERVISGVIDRMPGLVSCSCNMILSRIKGLRQ